MINKIINDKSIRLNELKLMTLEISYIYILFNVPQTFLGSRQLEHFCFSYIVTALQKLTDYEQGVCIPSNE